MDGDVRYSQREAVIPLSPHVQVWVIVDGGEHAHYIGPHPAVALRCVLTSASGPMPMERDGFDARELPDVGGMYYLVPASNMPGGGGWCEMRDLAFSDKMAKVEVANRNTPKQAGTPR